MVLDLDEQSESSFSVGRLEKKVAEIYRDATPSTTADEGSIGSSDSSFSGNYGTRKQRRKTVSFSGERNWSVHLIEAVDDSLHCDVWYSKEEFEFISMRDRLLLDSVEAGIFQETKEHTLRGLEFQMEEAFVKERRDRAIYAVFQEQYRLRMKGLRFLETLPATYLLRTRHAQKIALEAAKRDADEVERRRLRAEARKKQKLKRREERSKLKERRKNFPNLRLEV